ncbi:MAG: hypothetical protein ACKVE4_11270 [Dissulfuribacterales bacterium]
MAQTHKSLFSDKALKQLASILGRKDVKICYSKRTKTAKTNGETITLPSACMQDGSAMQAIQGYIDHETGHIRWSEFALAGEFRAKGAAWENMLNILEDVRIELLAVKAYPGMFFNLDNLTEYMKDSGLYQEPAKMADILNVRASRATKIITAIEAYLLCSLGSKILRYRLDEYAKASRKIAVKLTNEKIVTHITTLAEKIRYAKSTQDAADITTEIMEYLEQECNKLQQSKKPGSSQSEKDDQQQSGQDSGSGNNNDSNETDKPSNSNGDPNDDSDKPSNSNGDPGDEGKSDDNKDDGNGRSEQSQPQSGKDDQQQSGQDSGSGNNNSDDQQSQTSNQNSASGSGGSQNSENNDLSDSDNEKLDFTEVKEKDIKVKPRGEALADHLNNKRHKVMTRNGREDLPVPPTYYPKIRGLETCITPEINQIANMLKSKLISVMRSATLTRESSKRQGSRICTRSVHRAVTSPNPRIFKHKTLKQDINANIVVLIDRSGSTHSIKKEMNDNALIITKAFSSVTGIDIHVASFDNNIEVMYEGRGDNFTGFNPRSRGGTQTDMAMTHAIAALQSMPQKDKNIVFIITDGDPNSQYAAINGYCMLKQLNYEVYGIYVDGCVSEYRMLKLEEYTDKYAHILEPKDLPDQMLRMFRNSSNANYQVA